ncbi:NAD(P)/FAD-dependent oxidoreductase [Clostridium sardiniense]|uniref:NAD(P)/FAD-dependent oxidoreductase n=1 Tax=Clostridium sardiniense TaxID=29369 RepID=A0ABS7L054_CLOSR|nr:NAD(P)/FAD-dependent oxidoreductase [Clostridium sardiniense]MBY0756448.1 NAD(P)/FAD-dependent oxidoreductase [Clostridium sardiniense]MDQ0460189.1 thioredoxin reductase (NADPH) [Clostridium sardiniense]
MDSRYDIAIVGSGPAGLSAALNAKIRNKSFIIFGNNNLSDKIEKAPKVNNYLGFTSGTGKNLLESFQNHINKMGIEIVNERINTIYSMGDYFTLMVNQKMYEAKTVILATGVEYTKPLKGEEEFIGKGVGYCATCDAPLYKGKRVTIISYNEAGEEEANFVSELAGEVFFVPMYKGDYKLNDSINVIKETPIEIIGESKVSKVLFKNGEELETDGVFLLKNAVPPTQLVPGLEIEDGHIKVDRLMKTNIKGCFAAGDCIGTPYQYIKSAGEGNVAALSAASYLG